MALNPIVTLPPSQAEVLLEVMVMVVVGKGFTVTDVVAAVLVHPLAETVSEYVPEAPVVTFVMLGFCTEDVKPPGPVHA